MDFRTLWSRVLEDEGSEPKVLHQRNVCIIIITNLITRSGKAFRLVNSFRARAQSSRLKKFQKLKNGKIMKNQKNGESKQF